ncbi:MAG TPA: SDR family oxidoreductase [Thermoanaerobaculia bacterium]|nr:SDR family oxidoreductase [Thermoanaerobaculia bacterium]
MDLGIRGKHALVGGGSSGIGRSCAELLLREGCSVTIVSRGEDKLRAAVAELKAATGSAPHSVAADLATAAGVMAAFESATGKLGPVSILVNNTGGPKPGTFDALTDEDWAKAFELNLMSTVRMSRFAVEGMKVAGWGRIVNIMSVSVKQPIDGLMLSNSLRLGVVGFAKTLANELGRYGITVNTVGPGYTATDRLEQLAGINAAKENISTEKVIERWAGDVPVGRMGKPEEVAAAVVFLASQHAAYITGSIIAVDGGRVRSAL